MNPFRKRQHVLCAYVRDDSGDFWLFDGVCYLRFTWQDQGVWFVRAQKWLPAFAVATYPILDSAQWRTLKRAARRGRLSVRDYASVAACHRQLRREEHAQHIFDRTPPAGYFSFGEKTWKPGRRPSAD